MPFSPSPDLSQGSRIVLWVWVAICGVGVVLMGVFDVFIRVQMVHRRNAARYTMSCLSHCLIDDLAIQGIVRMA